MPDYIMEKIAAKGIEQCEYTDLSQVTLLSLHTAT